MSKKLNTQNFENELRNNNTVLVDFYAEWCGPCRMLTPTIEEIAKERTDISVGKVNIDENSNLAAYYGVMSIPTLIVFKDGKEHARLVGFTSKDNILAKLS